MKKMDEKQAREHCDKFLDCLSARRDFSKSTTLECIRSNGVVFVNYNDLSDYNIPLTKLFKQLGIEDVVSFSFLFNKMMELYIQYNGDKKTIFEEIKKIRTIPLITYTYYTGLKGAICKKLNLTFGDFTIMSFDEAKREFEKSCDAFVKDEYHDDFRISREYKYAKMYKDCILKVVVRAKEDRKAKELLQVRCDDFEMIASLLFALNDYRQLFSVFNFNDKEHYYLGLHETTITMFEEIDDFA